MYSKTTNFYIAIVAVFCKFNFTKNLLIDSFYKVAYSIIFHLIIFFWNTSELCIFGFSCAICRRFIRDQTIKAFIGLFMWSFSCFFFKSVNEKLPRNEELLLDMQHLHRETKKQLFFTWNWFIPVVYFTKFLWNNIGINQFHERNFFFFANFYNSKIVLTILAPKHLPLLFLKLSYILTRF